MPTVARYGETAQPNLVLIHGFLGSKADWLPLIPKLSQHFHCICLDLPGHGDNQPEIASTLTDGFDFCVQDIISRLDRLGIEAFYLYGYSLGGRIALHLAQAYPQRVLSLWLESCHPGLTNTEEQAARSKSDNLWAKRLQSLSSVDFLQLWYQQCLDSKTSYAARPTFQTHTQANVFGDLTCPPNFTLGSTCKPCLQVPFFCRQPRC